MGFQAHPTALVESESIGEGTRIWAFTHVMPGAVIGRNCNIADHCHIEGGSVVGDNVTVKNLNMVTEGVTLEDGVFVGPHVVFTNDRYARSPRGGHAGSRYADKASWLLPTVIRRGATLGGGSVILPGLVVGEYAMVAAGCVVTRDVPPHCLLKGNPGRPGGWVCFCGLPLVAAGGEARCANCGHQFEVTQSGVTPLGGPT
jgi:acetyltransferase-like isoleucine patch superfamily enzyme